MEARAYLRGLRMSPRKVQIVLDLIRNKPADIALATLRHTPKAACEPVIKLLNSAMANAENNHGMNKKHLYVSECFATPGTTMKRIRPRARGRAFRVLKRSCHITLAVKEQE
jgi:large subunit ribosomal protein L22